MDSNEPTIVAFAMVVVAGFAGTLWAATKKIQRSTEQLALTAAETAQRQLRAYVSGTPEFLLPVDDSASLRVRFKIHNSGATPAHEVRHRASVVVLLREDFRLPSLSANFSAPGVLFPNAALYGLATPEAPLDEATVVAVREGSARLYCYGEIDYVDSFMHPHTTRFCHEISGDPEVMRKLTSADAHDGLNMEFRIAPFGNAAN